MIVDLRSDTLTKPCAKMRIAMADAKVGDDVFMEDPTVQELEEFAASMFKMEASLFTPSGTMANQIAIKVHTRPMDEVILDMNSHIYFYEAGGLAFNSGVSVRTLQGERGILNPGQIEENINRDDIHFARSRVVSLENTANRGGGNCYEWENILKIKRICLQKGLALHLDGARLFNALCAKNQNCEDYGKTFDSISICLSKGLGAPVGSVLLGNKEFIKEARRVRKVLGGGMRQAGIIAAGGLFALKNNVKRLPIDHGHASMLAAALRPLKFVEQVYPQETNIVIFKTNQKTDAGKVVEQLREKKIYCLAMGADLVRFVTHLNINELQIKYVCDSLLDMRL